MIPEITMKSQHGKTFLSHVFAVLIVSTIGVVTAHAEAESCGVKRDFSTSALDELTWNQLNAIYTTIAEERYEQAREDLQKVLSRADNDRYLQAVIYQALAQVAWSQKNFPESLSFFERAVALDSLPDTAHFALMYQLAQLYAMQHRYDEALERLDLWFCMTQPERITAAAYVLKASIYMAQENYPGALSAIEKAIALDANPEESWYQLKLASHYELEHYPQAAATLGTMISRWPGKKQYWIQLSQIELRLKQEQKALSVLALAFRQGLLDSQTDILFLVSLYRNANIPYKAAEVLEHGIRSGLVTSDRYHWTLAAESWYAADELKKSLAAYERAGSVAVDGKTDLRRGFILVDQEDWRSAIEALDLALEKGGLDDRETGEAYLLRGMAQYNLGNLENAGIDWQRAGRYEKTREAARQWNNYLQEKLRRQVS